MEQETSLKVDKMTRKNRNFCSSSMFWLLVAVSLGTISQVEATVNKSLVIGYAIPYTTGWPMGINMAPSVIQGIREVRNRHLLDDYDIDFTWRDTRCQPLPAIRGIVDMKAHTDNLAVIIGEVCSTACRPMALFAAAWSLPYVSIGCMSPALSSRKMYPTFSRVIGTSSMTGPAYNGIATMMNWDRAGIIYDNSDVYRFMALSTKESMEKSGKMVFMRSMANTMNGDEVIQDKYDILKKVIEDMKEVTRAIYLFLYSADRRNSLIIAYDLGMLNGDWAIITSSVGPEIKQSFAYRPEIGVEIYEGVLVRDSMAPEGEEWNQFAQQVIDDFAHPTFDGMPKSPPNASLDIINVYAGMVHDAVLAWAYGVNKTVTLDHSPFDGFKVTENIYNFTFEGVTGTVTTDYKGERKPSYKVEIIQSGEMIKIMEWIAADAVMQKVYPGPVDDWSGLIWPGNKTEPPSGIPGCGWNNELCSVPEEDKTTFIIWVSVLVAVLTIGVTVGATILIQKRKYEVELNEATSVCISWTEIQPSERSKSVSNTASIKSSMTDLSMNQNFVETGKLRSDVVAIKRLGHNLVNVSDRQVRIELKVMKELRHENLNNFVGICLEVPNACVLMMYSTRGSLQDIIGDERVNLIWDLKVALSSDIAQGMKYIQHSEIGHHGHLKSSNCVVDNRWICKITDYGLEHIRNLSGLTPDDADISKHLLWTAPELLRNRGVTNMKQADVYSYGIVVQEIITEDEPFAYNSIGLEPHEIIHKIKFNHPVFRPTILSDACSEEWLSLIQSCWHEQPDQRPSFHNIIHSIHKLDKGKSQNMVDDMINRLEVHTNHLEKIVAERSVELKEEKDKMEVLLRELLPASVADSLTAGQQVAPESFDEVTIFFSDIVSFTKIASQGTPMDVVKMLNSMYTVFDEVSSQFDVYKLATIGDAYFVASGVPIRNGNRHASEICDMAIMLLENLHKCEVPHLPGEILKLRTGVHSGPCVAGVCGIKMPRYLLFGDTVDIASKMESEGESMKIHVSQFTEQLLRKVGGFDLELRGKRHIKGAGEIDTFFLVKGSK